MKKLLKKWFGKAADPVLEKYNIVLVDDSDKICDALGLTAKRIKELHPLLMDSLKTSRSTGHAMETFSKHCKHPNEIAFFCFIIGYHHSVTSQVATFLNLNKHGKNE